ncbi:MAG: hypothetical protein ACSHX6_03000 [Akkermansiaceae bacterium]
MKTNKPMKPIITLMKWSSCLLLTSSTLSAQDTIEERNERAKQVELFYNMAEKAYQDGDVDAARESLRSALALNGRHAHSIALARRMQTSGNQTVLARRKRIFSSVMVPLIDLNEANVKDAVNVLAKIVETESKGKVIPNFVIQDKNNVLEDSKISIKLKNVPAGDVLEHLLRASASTASFGKYTTIIRPRERAEKAPNAVESSTEE